MAKRKHVITQESPNLRAQPEVLLDLNTFEAAIFNKGYDVHYDKMVKCPCKSKEGDELVSCQNCATSGWVLVQRFKTKMVLQSINVNTKYKEWSEEKLGTINITALERDRLAFMDRITLLDAESVHNQVLYPREFNNQLFVFTVYDINNIIDLFLFVAPDKPLTKLEEGVDFNIIERNKITFNKKFKAYLDNDSNLSISVRYAHPPQFHIIDIARELMSTSVEDLDKQRVIGKFPVNAIGRRSHYVLDSDNFTGDYIIDNSRPAERPDRC